MQNADATQDNVLLQSVEARNVMQHLIAWELVHGSVAYAYGVQGRASNEYSENSNFEYELVNLCILESEYEPDEFCSRRLRLGGTRRRTKHFLDSDPQGWEVL